MASSVQILLNTLDVTPLIDYESVHVDNNVIMTSDTMSFTMIVLPGDTVTDTANSSSVAFVRPFCGNEIIWQNPNVVIKAPDGSSKPYREFGGVVTEVHETLEGASLIYEVSCKSYVQWFDRHLIQGWYPQQAPETTVKAMVSRFCPGFTTYNVKTSGTTITPVYSDYQRPSEAIKSVADQAQLGWYVDYFKDVHMYTFENFNSPLPNNILDADNDVVNYGNLSLVENSEQQINKIYIKGFKTRSADLFFLPFTADGTTFQWSLGYRVSSVSGDVDVVVYDSMAQYNADAAFKSGSAPSAGTKMVLKRDIIDGAPDRGGASNTAYIHYTQHLVRIPNWAGTNAAVPSGKVVVVRFHYLKDMVWSGQDPEAQTNTAAVEGGKTDGVYEDVYSDASLTNSTISAVQSKGQLLLMKYRFPQISGTFESYFNATTKSGWVAGQNFILQSDVRFGGINDVMFVQRVSKSIVKNDTGSLIVFYNVEFADSPYLV
jgi:hypothetical protein